MHVRLRKLLPRAIVALTPVLALSVASAIAAGPAQASAKPQVPTGPVSFPYYTAANPANCLDASITDINQNGDPVTLEPCTGGQNQLWRRNNVYPGELINVESGLCLDADNNNITKIGDTVWLWTCWNGPNQQWNSSSTSYPFELINAASGMCLDADNNHITTNGDKVQLYTCWNGPNQQWHIILPS